MSIFDNVLLIQETMYDMQKVLIKRGYMANGWTWKKLMLKLNRAFFYLPFAILVKDVLLSPLIFPNLK